MLFEVEPSVVLGMERAGDYTGENLFRKRPEVYRAIVALLGSGMGINRIAKALGVTEHTVMIVRDRETVDMARAREDHSRQAYQLGRLAFESAADDLLDPDKRAKIPARDKAIIGGIAFQHAQNLAGEATAVVEVRHTGPSLREINAWVESIDVEAVKPEPKETNATNESVLNP